MSERAGLFYFSGTSNTELVAELYKAELESHGAAVDLMRIEDLLREDKRPDTESYSLIGVGYVIHALNAPRIVYEFIEKLPTADGKKVFLFKCPGDAFMEGGATSMIRGRLKGRGYGVFHETLVVMPSNVAVRWGDDVVLKLHSIASGRVKAAVAEILSGRSRLQENPLHSRIASRLFSLGETLGARLFGRLHLRASSACNLCGKCVRECPTKNIRMEKGKILFGWDCILCLRCVYGCPVNAISPIGFGAMVIKPYRKTRNIIEEKDPNEVYHADRARNLFTPAMNRYLKG